MFWLSWLTLSSLGKLKSTGKQLLTSRYQLGHSQVLFSWKLRGASHFKTSMPSCLYSDLAGHLPARLTNSNQPETGLSLHDINWDTLGSYSVENWEGLPILRLSCQAAHTLVYLYSFQLDWHTQIIWKLTYHFGISTGTLSGLVDMANEKGFPF